MEGETTVWDDGDQKTYEDADLETLTDWDGHSWLGLDREIEQRERLRDEEPAIKNPERSIHSLDEMSKSRLDTARNYTADFIETEERSIGNLIYNLGIFGSGLVTSSAVNDAAFELLNIDRELGVNLDTAIGIPVTLGSMAAGFGAAVYGGVKLNQARDSVAEKIRPTSMQGKPLIGEDVERTVDRMMRDSEMVEVTGVTGTDYELSESVEGEWNYRYLATRESEPGLHHISWQYDPEAEELEWVMDYIIDWKDESPIELGEDYLGSVDAWRFRGVLEEKEPDVIYDLFEDWDVEEQKELVEQRYGKRIRELYEENNFFDKGVEMQEMDRVTRPKGFPEGHPGTITSIKRYPVSSN